MARITQDSLQKLFDNIDIIELISSYIDVRKEGANYAVEKIAKFFNVIVENYQTAHLARF